MNIKDAVWGFAVGDALGVPYEFSTRHMMIENPATDMIGFGTYNQPPGTWSDDTSMLLCVLENIITRGSTKNLAILFLKWYQEGNMTAHGELFDIGITTRTALENLIRGEKPSKSGLDDEMSAGNGSLMRSLPYAFVENLPKSILKMVFENKITHRNYLSSICCMYYVKMMRAILDGSNKLDAANKASSYIRFGWRITDEEEDDDLLETKKKFKRLLSKDFYELPETAIQSTGYVISSLEASVWCFLNTNNYKEAVLKAVNLGGDTDTIAALTGGLAGLYYGCDSIPENWMSKLAGKSIIQKVLNKTDLDAKYLQPI